MPSAGQQPWNPVNEDLENNDARIKDTEYNDLLGKELDLEGTAKALGGIGAVAPEEGERIAAKAIEQEQNERENPELDLESQLAQLDGIDVGEEMQGEQGESALVGSEGDDNITGSEQLEIDLRQQKALELGLFSPRIDSLVLQGKLGDITPKEVETLKATLLSGNINDIDSIQESELSADKKSTVVELLTESENPENQAEYAKNFTKDFGAELKDFQNAKGEFKSDLDQSAYEMISARYITALEGEVSIDERKSALDIAFKTALNTELDGKIIKETESFKQICKDIRDDSLPIGDKFLAFKDLLSYTSLEQGKGGKRQETMYRKRTAEQILTDSGRLERFKQLLALFKAQEEGSSKSVEIAQELEAIRLESGISTGDASLLTGGGALDIVTDDISENPRESA